jgi:hypothetical protein
MTSANVESIEALREFRSRLCKLAEQVQAALSEAESELSRTIEWLSHTQTMHWKSELRIRAEDLTRARSALTRKKAEKSPTGARQSVVEEEKAFKKAQRRLEEAQQKQAAVKRWTRLLDQAAFSYRPVAQSLMSTVEVDVPRGLARIDSMALALETYLAGGPPPEWVKSEISETAGRMVRTAEPDREPERVQGPQTQDQT